MTKRKTHAMVSAAKARTAAMKPAKGNGKRRSLGGTAAEHKAVLAAMKQNAREQLAELKYASTCEERLQLATGVLEAAGALTIESRHGRIDKASHQLAGKLRKAAQTSLRSCFTRSK